MSEEAPVVLADTATAEESTVSNVVEAVEAVTLEEPKAEEAVAEEPKAEEAVAEEPKAVDEAGADAVAEVATEEPKTEESA